MVGQLICNRCNVKNDIFKIYVCPWDDGTVPYPHIEIVCDMCGYGILTLFRQIDQSDLLEFSILKK